MYTKQMSILLYSFRFSITGLKILETNLSVHEEEEKEVKTEYREAKEVM